MNTPLPKVPVVVSKAASLQMNMTEVISPKKAASLMGNKAVSILKLSEVA